MSPTCGAVALFALSLAAGPMAAQELVAVGTPDGLVLADAYGAGTHGVVLAHDPRELLVLDGAAHAQLLFATPAGSRLMREILRFLTEP